MAMCLSSNSIYNLALAPIATGFLISSFVSTLPSVVFSLSFFTPGSQNTASASTYTPPPSYPFHPPSSTVPRIQSFLPARLVIWALQSARSGVRILFLKVVLSSVVTAARPWTTMEARMAQRLSTRRQRIPPERVPSQLSKPEPRLTRVIISGNCLKSLICSHLFPSGGA